MFDKALARIGASLNKAGIPYMIIGGQAVLLYGEPRLTRDIDITLGVNIDQLETLLDVAQQLSLKPLPEDVAAFVHQTMVLPALDEETGIRSGGFYLFFHALRIPGDPEGEKSKNLEPERLFCGG